MQTTRGTLGSFVIAIATAFVIVAVALPLFVNPLWVAFEQDRADAVTWTGFAPADLRFATDEILADLVIGPPDFDVVVDGNAVLDARERAHMRDVRGVFLGFFAIAIVLAAGAAIIGARRGVVARARTWGAIRIGALGLIVVLVAVGAIAFVAFDALFEVFHQLLFAGGSYTFDPRTQRLVQLFPFQFWQDSAIAVGGVSIALAGLVAIASSGRATTAMPRTAPTVGGGASARASTE
ncbi:MAG: lipoprotein intramolecular transacylase Lit [Candidatus Limnocylindrales bacterium]